MIELKRPPYLVQLARIRDQEDYPEQMLSQTLSLEYMGAAEFEFGAIPKAYREIAKRFDHYTLSSVQVDDSGQTLFVAHYFNEEDFQKYVEYLRILRDPKREREISTKEPVRFLDPTTDKWYRPSSDPETGYYRNNFWWDIKNQVMWSFNEEFMLRLRNRLGNSVDYVKSVDATKVSDA